ncbi:MAG: hypothetical protein HQL87_11005 [Magnetococcales bacterium]|nr:hypothetical protein [Magnetococcales bacterium]
MMNIKKETLIPFLQGMGNILEIVPLASSCSVRDPNIHLRASRVRVRREAARIASVQLGNGSVDSPTLQTKNPMEADRDALRKDWESIGKDWRKVIGQVRGKSGDR